MSFYLEVILGSQRVLVGLLDARYSVGRRGISADFCAEDDSLALVPCPGRREEEVDRTNSRRSGWSYVE